MRGLRASMRASHEPGELRRPFQVTTDIAPTISNRRMSRCPIFEVRPNLCLPPLECWRGTSPSQAAKSRPRRKFAMAGAKVSIAMGVTGHGDGILLRLVGHPRLQRLDAFRQVRDLVEVEPRQIPDEIRQIV